MAKTKKKARRRERRERRFEPRSAANPAVVSAAGGLGAAALGAGFYGQFVRAASAIGEPMPFAPYVLAAGAVVLGSAIWFGTSGEPVLRVGDGGVALEKGDLRRLPWHSVEGISFDSGLGILVVRGHDEAGVNLVVNASLKAHPQAAAWILKEARERIPAKVTVEGETPVPAPRDDAGEMLVMDALQVVGRRCAASDTAIAYEPDARICPRCERAYHKDHVPAECACGAPLTNLLEAKGETPPPAEEPPPPADAAATT